ncbi:MAG: transglutaminase-like domain-containing protein [Gammaproteobacteria bacterium]|nr:transglutaminase-like domain-containing protein [Gammaproteobacteria bacterium]
MSINKKRQNEASYMRRFAFALSLMGIVLIVIHYLTLDGRPAHGDENWLITIDSSHVINNEKTVISIQPPYESKNIRLVGRSLNHAGLRLLPASTNTAIPKRSIRLRPDLAGKYQTVAEFTLQLSQTPHFHKGNTKALSSERRQFFLADDELLQLEDRRLSAELVRIGVNEADSEKLVERIFKIFEQFSSHRAKQTRHAAEILASRSADHNERARLMVALCRKAGIPARLITGLEIKDDPFANPQYWVEVYINDSWSAYHPGLGFQRQLPVNYVAFDKYGEGIVSGRLAGKRSTTDDYVFANDINIERIPATLSSPDNLRAEWYQVFMLDRLPADTRMQLALLMLLPLGALISSLIRQLWGVHSFGVFTPTILALAVTYAERETTILILTITLLLVYFGRPTFHHQMSRTPRLSIIFTLVASSMVIGVSVLDHFSLATEGHLILLPIVIITSLVDRFFSSIEKMGSHTAFVRLAWTLILTVITLPVLQMDWLGALILRYPESHLFTLSLLIMIAYYPFGKHKIPHWLSFLREPRLQRRKEDSA